MIGNPGPEWIYVNDINDLTCLIEGLSEKTTYEVQVQATDGQKTSDWTESVIFTTTGQTAINELTAITGQKAVQTLSKKDISNFKVRKKMPIGVRVTLRRDRMYEFMERFIRIALPRIRDFKGVNGKLDGRGNYTVGVTEQIIFPEINIDNVTKMTGMNITFVTTAKTDEEGYALLKEFGIPFNNK